MTEERAEKILSVVKKTFNALYIALGLCIIICTAFIASLILACVIMIFVEDAEKKQEKNGCVRIQGVTDCYRKPEGDSVDPHPPSHDGRPRPTRYDYRPR